MTSKELNQLSPMLLHKVVTVTMKQSQIPLQGIWDRTEFNTVTMNRRIILKTENEVVAIPLQNIDSIIRKS